MSVSPPTYRVLIIAPRFFGYEEEIAAEFRRRGAEVDMMLDRPFETAAMKAVTRFRPELVIGAADRLYRRTLANLGRVDYRHVLVVNGQTVSEEILRELRVQYPRARLTLYMWDSFKNRKRALRNLQYFDDALSFDRECAQRYGLRFRPLFFSPGFSLQRKEAPPAYHLSFIGTAHTDRFAITSAIARNLPPGLRFYRYLYLQAPWVFYFHRCFNRAFRDARRRDFEFAPLPRATVQRVFFQSGAILDIEHPKQTGLTIRTLETLGAARKLVTTNRHVRDYDFFLDENIWVIDRRAPLVPETFLQTEYRPIAPELYRKYSLAGWMDEVLNLPLTGKEVRS